MDKPSIKIVGIPGSLRSGSYTKRAIEMVLAGAAEKGAETHLIDLKSYDLVFYGQVKEADYPEDVWRLKKVVKSAHGIILGTPEYHGGLSGVLKNALDLMGFEEFEGKMIGLVGIAGGKMGASNSLNALRHIGRNLHAWVLPQQISIPESHKQFDKEGNLNNESIRSRCREVGGLIAQFATLHEMSKDQEFVKLWESLASNPGGE